MQYRLTATQNITICTPSEWMQSANVPNHLYLIHPKMFPTLPSVQGCFI